MGDPACKMEIRDKSMHIPLSHPLAFNVTMNPHYDGVIERISEFIRARDGRLIYIDVGANIGDTILFCNPDKDDQILGIDADDLYLDYFHKNLGNLQNVKFLKAICSSSDDRLGGIIKRDQGTAKVVEDEEIIIITKTLDSIIQEYDEFNTITFLKVDTDGFDFEVLKGAENTISKNRPAVLFECELNDNEKYVEQFSSTIQLFQKCGYQSALLYDNFGYLFSRIELDNLSKFKYPLFYQLSRAYFYYDILMMPEHELQTFLKSEISFFLDQIQDKLVRNAAQFSLRLEDRS
jgi:FkbM family methyltransferase